MPPKRSRDIKRIEDFKIDENFLDLPIWRHDEEDARNTLDLMDEFSPVNAEDNDTDIRFLNLTVLLALAAKKEENGEVFKYRLRELENKKINKNLLLITRFLSGNFMHDGSERMHNGPADISSLQGWIYFLMKMAGKIENPQNTLIEFEAASKTSCFPDLIYFYEKFTAACADLGKLNIHSDIIKLRTEWYSLEDSLNRISAGYRFPAVFRELFTLIPQIKIIHMLVQLIFRELSLLQNNIYDEFSHDDSTKEYELFMAALEQGCPRPAFMGNPLIRNISANLHNSIMLRRSLGDKISSYITSSERKRVLREKNVTILFSDLREFTSLTEEFLKIEESNSHPGGMNFLWTAIKSYMGRAAQIIEVHNFGWVDKFIGDAVMAVFGLEISSENKDRARSAVRALDSAFEIHDFVNGELKETMLGYLRAGVQNFSPILIEKIKALNSGFGLDYGTALFGEIGNNSRIDWTVLGNPVNTASRLEAKTRIMPGALLFTEDFLKKLVIESDIITGNTRDVINSENRTANELEIISESSWKIFNYRIIFLRLVTLKGQTVQRKVYTAIRTANEKEGEKIARYNELMNGFYHSKNPPSENEITEFIKFKSHPDLSGLEGWDEHFNWISSILDDYKRSRKWMRENLITNFSEK